MKLFSIIIFFALTGCSTYHLQEKVGVIEDNQKAIAQGVNAAFAKINARLTLLENPAPDPEKKK